MNTRDAHLALTGKKGDFTALLTYFTKLVPDGEAIRNNAFVIDSLLTIFEYMHKKGDYTLPIDGVDMPFFAELEDKNATCSDRAIFMLVKAVIGIKAQDSSSHDPWTDFDSFERSWKKQYENGVLLKKLEIISHLHIKNLGGADFSEALEVDLYLLDLFGYELGINKEEPLCRYKKYSFFGGKRLNDLLIVLPANGYNVDSRKYLNEPEVQKLLSEQFFRGLFTKDTIANRNYFKTLYDIYLKFLFNECISSSKTPDELAIDRYEALFKAISYGDPKSGSTLYDAYLEKKYQVYELCCESGTDLDDVVRETKLLCEGIYRILKQSNLGEVEKYKAIDELSINILEFDV